MNNLISVIMSVYNEEIYWVKQSVESILNQTYQEIEIIIVLDNPDNILLKELLESYEKKDSRIKLILNKKNIGLVSSLNKALFYCRGKYVARMDADDISLDSRLELEKSYLEKHDLDFIFTGVVVIDEKANKLYETNEREFSNFKTRKLLEKGNISRHPTWFLKKEIYDELEGYRDVPYCEDYDFSLRCLNKNYKIGKMNQNVLLYRIRNESITRNFGLEQFLNARGILHLYKKGNLDNYVFVSEVIKKSKEKSNNKEIKKYNLAYNKYNYAVKQIKEKRLVIGFWGLLGSMVISKYFALKILDVMKYKLSEKMIK